MRPVRLDLAGFASFREPATVDFTDADYFALVGPTGSGKSTVIDAMTFALYGSVPRWGRSNAIADALAPTTNRCTVRLVFDVGPARYVVAREVRRVGKAVQQKHAVLERLPAGAGPDAPGEVLAGDQRQVTRTVEGLLGLSFSDFCQCIVLPQGQFAEFLGATPGQRQDILLKLLGAGHYEAIGRGAATRAAAAAERAAVLEAQAGDLAAVGDDVLAALHARVGSLEAVSAAVATAGPRIADADRRLAEATADLDRLTLEHARLLEARRPAGVADLQAGLDTAERARATAAAREEAALARDTAARAALAAGPDRARLETVLVRHGELERLTAGVSAVVGGAVAAAERQDDARAAADDAQALAEKAREVHDTARETVADARAAHEALLARRVQVARVRPPAGVDVLAARVERARAGHDAARAAREAAEVAGRRARAAAAGAGAVRGPLEQALRTLAERAQAGDELSALVDEHGRLTAALEAARRVGARRQDALDEARRGFETAAQTRAAASLRPHLEAGHACPVCDQTVTTLPPPLAAPEVDAARERLETARRELVAADEATGLASRAEAAQAARVRAGRERLDRLGVALAELATVLAAEPAGRLPGGPVAGPAGGPDDGMLPGFGPVTEPAPPADLDAGELRDRLERLDASAAAAAEAEDALAAARADEDAARAELDGLDGQVRGQRAAVRAAHGPLIALGAPELDDTDPAAAWATLDRWAAARVRELDERLLPGSEAALAVAGEALTAANRAVADTARELREAQAAHTAAVAAAVEAAGARRALLARLDELRAALEQQPTADQAAEGLDRCTRLETEARHAERELLDARGARVRAERDRAGWDERARAARRELRATRDRLVALGAPELDDADLAAAWAALLDWAGAQAAVRAREQPAGRERIDAVRRERDDLAADLDRALADAGLAPGAGPGAGVAPGPADAPARVAAALERARAEAESAQRRRARASELTARIAAAREEQQVARLLADLLRADKFPRWLASAALDTLVTDASAVLSDLSGGQFDLSHEKGEFVVVDHTDADSRRSVRTLSGGETFQASLALALALSEQMATLATAGAARLDSIFLDEGFGTLDPETLETVAGTLENLARGERMVGVITHVAALAERAPVRFAVRRDHRTSSIVRESV